MKIIAVDDEQGALKLLNEAIVKAVNDAELVSFGSPLEALGYAEKNLVDIAFTDIHMFTMTGLELAARLKKTNPLMNIIFVTGFDEYAKDAVTLHASGYVTKPVTALKIEREMNNLLHPTEKAPSRFYARTFGNFDFLVDGKPISFPREKSKELLALLVDREGASLTTEQMAAVLYEERNYDRGIKNQLMTVIRCLTETLTSAGAVDAVIKTWGHLALNTSAVRCDAYDYMRGDPEAINRFRGEYMAQYSWAEERAAEFYWENEKKK